MSTERVLPVPRAVAIGRWWFKNRSLSPIPLFALMVVLTPDVLWTAPAMALIILGIALAQCIRIWAVGYAGSATRTRGNTVPQLVHAGPFRLVRNPLYVANILLYSLCSLLFGFYWLTAFTFVFSCVEYTFIVRFEEDTLRHSFGAPYQKYCDSVWRWWVSPIPRIGSSDHVFELKRALRSERSTLYSVTAMAVIFAVKTYFLQQKG